MINLRLQTLIAGAFAITGTTVAVAPAVATGADGRTAAERSQVVRSVSRSRTQDNERARGLVRIGEDGIAQPNDAALDAYFAKTFVYHGPDGDMNYEQLKANFAKMRAAFSDFTVSREFIMVKGDMVSARTTMTGRFTGPFSAPPFGTLAPTGKPIMLELINVFRYDAQGKLAEEWVQSDRLGFLRQLGLKLEPARTAR